MDVYTGGNRVAILIGSNAGRTIEVGLIRGLRKTHGEKNVDVLRSLSEAEEYLDSKKVDLLLAVYNGEDDESHANNINEIFDRRRVKHVKVLAVDPTVVEMDSLEREMFSNDHVVFLPTDPNDDDGFNLCASSVVSLSAAKQNSNIH